MLMAREVRVVGFESDIGLGELTITEALAEWACFSSPVVGGEGGMEEVTGGGVVTTIWGWGLGGDFVSIYIYISWGLMVQIVLNVNYTVSTNTVT